MTDLATARPVDPTDQTRPVDQAEPAPGTFPVTELDLEAFRPQLTGYCYRMLGSVFEAEDAVQETLVRAWRGIDHFEGRAPFGAWLYRIATNVCLTMLRGRQRRAYPVDIVPSSPPTAQPGVPLPPDTWIEPAPDGRVLPTGSDPADAAVSRESIRLAFVAALQLLPPRQRAVLILRDVLSWRAREVADLLETSEVSVKSALQRARRTLAAADLAAPVAFSPPVDAAQRALLERFVDAFARYDIDTLVTLLHEDAVLSMPPLALWIQGRADIGQWWRNESGCRDARQVLTQANGAPALGLYRPTGPDGAYEPLGILVLEVAAGRIGGMHAFLDPRLFPLFDLPEAPPTGN